MSIKFYDDWMFYDYNDLKIQKYPYPVPYDLNEYTLRDALVCQASSFVGSIERPTVFMSGGIDSQCVAYAFKLANIPFDCVFIKTVWTPTNRWNSYEYFFAKTFCDQYDIKLHVTKFEYDPESLEELLLRREFWDTGTGSGTIFQLEAIQEWMVRNGGYPITADGHFIFRRERDVCSGTFKKPGLSLSHGIRLENQMLFDFYAPYMFMYYHNAHFMSKEIQYMRKYEAKNLIYTELGFPLRPKLSGWEFLDETNDYGSLSTIDWSDDHSERARLTTGLEAILSKFSLSKDFKKKLIEDKMSHRKSDKGRFITLYEFNTDVYQYPY